MPIYEYKCKSCGKIFDALVSVNDSDKKIKCEHCGSKKTAKLISGFAVKSEGRIVSSSGSCGTCSSGNCNTCK